MRLTLPVLDMTSPPATRPLARPEPKVARRRRDRGRGQALTEFALVIPIFMLILGGIIDAGFMLYSRMSVINAAREGARAAVTQIDNVMGIPDIVHNAVQSAATGLVPADLTDTSTCVTSDQIQGVGSRVCDFVAGGLADPKSGDAIKVSTTYVYHSLFLQLWGQTITVVSTIQMVIE